MGTQAKLTYQTFYTPIPTALRAGLYFWKDW